MTADLDMVRGLLRPGAYPEETASVELAETHISWVFLTDRHAYKVKKPVDYGFLDFTTLEKRRHYCGQEVELNRRTAPDVYLGVVEVKRRGQEYTVGGPGEVTDYAVKMVRLPQDRILSRLLAEGQVSQEEIRKLAGAIARFHAAAQTSEEITRLGGLEAVRQNVEENFAQTATYVPTYLSLGVCEDLKAYSDAFLDAKRAGFRRREAEGHIRDCHGDLHAGQIFMTDELKIVDCIEFNQRFRYSDVAADLAFLAMDLDFHGRQDLSRILVDEYVGRSGDTGLLEFLDFFKVYRAHVRAKVACFRLDDASLPATERERLARDAQAYMDLAFSYVNPFRRPSLALVAGLMGTGKTTVAAELARRYQLTHISSDVVRKELAGIPGMEHRYEEFGQGIYSPEFSQRTYQAVLDRAEEELRNGRSVVLDATFRMAGERLRAVELAGRMALEAWVVECVLPEQEVRRRLEERLREGASASDGRWELYRDQKKEWEPVREVRDSRHVRLDTGGGKDEVLQRLVRALHTKAIEGLKRQGR